MKPLALVRYLVKLVTPPGGMVLDPFAGSGTTLLAAKKEGFSAIGIEIEPEYYEIALARIDLAQKSLDFFGGNNEI
jgi:site-specific DNA-methyltransferase (adenine-specific)